MLLATSESTIECSDRQDCNAGVKFESLARLAFHSSPVNLHLSKGALRICQLIENVTVLYHEPVDHQIDVIEGPAVNFR